MTIALIAGLISVGALANLAILLLIICGIFYVVRWALTKMGAPQPAFILLYVVVAIIALLLLVQMLQGGGLGFGR